MTLADLVQTRAAAWGVPLLIGEFTNFTLGMDARQLTDSDMAQTRSFLSWAKEHGVSWTFWAYVNAYRPMTVVDYSTNQAIPVVKLALDAGLDTPDPNVPPRPCSRAGAASWHAPSAARPPAIRTGRSWPTTGTSVTGLRTARG